jgi:hypothetical protein
MQLLFTFFVPSHSYSYLTAAAAVNYVQVESVNNSKDLQLLFVVVKAEHLVIDIANFQFQQIHCSEN